MKPRKPPYYDLMIKTEDGGIFEIESHGEVDPVLTFALYMLTCFWGCPDLAEDTESVRLFREAVRVFGRAAQLYRDGHQR